MLFSDADWEWALRGRRGKGDGVQGNSTSRCGGWSLSVSIHTTTLKIGSGGHLLTTRVQLRLLDQGQEC